MPKPYLTVKECDEFFSNFPEECCSKCKFWVDEANETPTFPNYDAEDVYYNGDCHRHAHVILSWRPDDWWPMDCGVHSSVSGRGWCGDFIKT